MWFPVLDELTHSLLAHYGEALISIALRGSVARGTDVAGVSDLDLVLFLRGRTDPVALRTSHMPDLTIEATPINADTFPSGPADEWMRFALALSGRHVWGADVVGELPQPRLGLHAMGHLPRADQWLAKWPVYWAEETSDADRKDICQWLMKRIIRSLMESQMLRLGA
ncbi:MAG: nucleotidyltransferase domain-containing protein [Pseudomonadota bacterium]